MTAATIFACVVGLACHTQVVRVEPKYCHHEPIPFETQIAGEWVKGTAGVRCAGR